MRYPFVASTRWFMAALVLLLALPDTSAAQVRSRDRDGETGRSRAIPRNEAPAPPPAAQPAPAAAPVNESGQTARQTTPRTFEATGSGSTTTTSRQNQGARPRDGRPADGVAVRRGSVPPPPRAVEPSIRHHRGYRPWGFGGASFGSYYGSAYGPYVFYDPYSPWYGRYGSHRRHGTYSAYGYPPYGYGYPSSVYAYPADGELRLKIKPRDAQVFVDGYFVGIVDDFDGAFQRLHLPSGPHRIEVRAPGYEALTFDVQIRFAETTKFEGDLRRTW